MVNALKRFDKLFGKTSKVIVFDGVHEVKKELLELLLVRLLGVGQLVYFVFGNFRIIPFPKVMPSICPAIFLSIVFT